MKAYAMMFFALSTLAGCMPSLPIGAGPCNPNTDPNACGCCFAGEVRQCPPGVPVPDAGVITLPVCGGG